MAFAISPDTHAKDSRGSEMLFGEKTRFAIEIGSIEPLHGHPFCQFRFWVCGTPIGDWDDCIPVRASVENMRLFCHYSTHRVNADFGHASPQEVFEWIYDAFFSADYTEQLPEVPNLRDRFHMDDIGMSATLDKFGIVLVAPSVTSTRLIVKDLSLGTFICDCRLHFGEVEEVGKAYIAWGDSLLCP